MCVSHDIEVTPSTLKSKGWAGNPASSKNGTKKLPKQQSTCIPILRFFAIAANVGISSIIPCGKFGADPAICQKLVRKFFCLYIIIKYLP